MRKAGGGEGLPITAADIQRGANKTRRPISSLTGKSQGYKCWAQHSGCCCQLTLADIHIFISSCLLYVVVERFMLENEPGRMEVRQKVNIKTCDTHWL